MSEPFPAFNSPLLNRRRFLADAGIGLGAIALTHLLGRQGLLAASFVALRFVEKDRQRST